MTEHTPSDFVEVTTLTRPTFFEFYDRLTTYRHHARVFAQALGYQSPVDIPDEDFPAFLLLWAKERHPLTVSVVRRETLPTISSACE